MGAPSTVVLAMEEHDRLKAPVAPTTLGNEADIGLQGGTMADQAQKDRFVKALAELGGSAANGLLRETLQWDEATYNAVKNDLVAGGAVTQGRGRGGSVSLGDVAEAEAQDSVPVAARAKAARGNGNSNGGNLGFEAELFKAADKLRGNMEPSDYKHVALGLIFLKHISDSFEAKRAELLADYPDGAEDPDEYSAENVFWVPKEARWSHLQANAKQPSIGKMIDEAMIAIEKRNESLKGVLPKDYARPALNAVMLGELIDLISGIALGQEKGEARDVLGRVYEYFLGQFAGSEGKRGGEFYTPRSFASWSRCSNPTRAAFTTRVAARAACSFNPKNLPKNTKAGSATSRSMVRSRTTRRGVCAR
jgi:type I restriction enzyme M protein